MSRIHRYFNGHYSCKIFLLALIFNAGIINFLYIYSINSSFENKNPAELDLYYQDNLKISLNGDLIWEETWGYSTNELLPIMAWNNETNLIVAGNINYGGSTDIFLINYTSEGIQLWNKTWDKNSHDQVEDVILDGNNNIYLAGRTGTFGASDKVMLIIKCNSSGDEIWHREWSGSNDMGARAIALDSHDDIYVVGRPDNDDIFLRKYNSEGDLNWSRTWGGTGGGYEAWPGVYGIYIDIEDNIYLTGRSDTLGEGGQDTIILCYNKSGDLQWSKTWGYTSDERGYDIMKAPDGYIYTTSFESSSNLLYLIKFDSLGNQIWNKSLGVFDIESGFEMDIDYYNNIYITGSRQNNDDDISLLLVGNSGYVLHEINWSSNYLDRGCDILLNDKNEAYVAGYTTGIGAGQKDLVLLKFKSLYYSSPIFINGAATGVGANNWTWASSQFWCSGSGTWADPYIIENIIIDAGGSGSGLIISDSDVYFIIKNSKIYNSGVNGYDSGVQLINVNNGKLFYNNFSNNFHGIYLRSGSSNNTIEQNIISNVGKDGLYVSYSDSNFISNNKVNNDGRHGMIFSHSNNNLIIGNEVNNNTIYGIHLDWCPDNTVIKNTAENNGLSGIALSGSNTNNNNISMNILKNNDATGIIIFSGNDNNHIINNTFIDNILNAQDDGSNNDWDNGFLGNYWSDYTGVDVNDDGIGDTPYNIGGTAGSQDNYPIWDDGLDIPTLYIDGLASGVGAQNWTWASSKTWCSGSGTFKDPYIIKDLVINGGGTDTCIDILNSDVYFIIQNCTLYNAGVGTGPFFHAGIRFYNVSNGKLIKNNASNNLWSGIRIYFDCDNNTVVGNIASNNPDLGIYLRDGCNDNKIINNTCNDNGQWGIELYIDCDNNTLTRNIVKSNDKVGIQIYDGCDENYIYNNTVTGNTQFGIRFRPSCYNNIIYKNIISNNPSIGMQFDSNCDDNLIYYNHFIDNPIQAHDSGTNNQWDNGIIGNYWSDYVGIDANDDGIGDVPYDNITGTALSQDNYPIWEDGDDLLPYIIILEPTPYQLFETNAPDFIVKITDRNLHKMWYTLDNGLNIFTFTTNETINEAAWDLKSNGTVTIIFYANDTVGHTSFKEITVRKDIEAPEISILEPSMNDIFEIAPAYQVTVVDGNLDRIWYTLNDGQIIFIDTELTGIINQELWDDLPNGYVTIRFYANDTLGHLSFEEVIVVKDAPTPGNGTIPGYNLFALIGITILMVIIVLKFRRRK